MGYWINNIFTLALIAFWLGLFTHSLWQRRRMRTKSEKLEIQAGLGKSASGLFHDISGHVANLSLYTHLLESKTKKTGFDSESFSKLSDLLKLLVQYTRNFKQLVSNIYKEGNEFLDLTKLLDLLVETQVYACYRKMEIEVVKDYQEENLLIPARAFEGLFNVIRNACEAMEDSPKKILLIKVQTQGKIVNITVSDTGCGISPDNMKKIFEYGFTSKAEGSGQGMTIARHSIEKVGGALKIESEEGKGTVVAISLPVQGIQENQKET